MTSDVRREATKALAYGETDETIREVMGVTSEDIKSISAEEVHAEREYLKEMGYIPYD